MARLGLEVPNTITLTTGMGIHPAQSEPINRMLITI